MEPDSRLRAPSKPPKRTIRPSGGSTVITIPPAILEELGLEEGDELEIFIDDRPDSPRLVLQESTE